MAQITFLILLLTSEWWSTASSSFWSCALSTQWWFGAVWRVLRWYLKLPLFSSPSHHPHVYPYQGWNSKLLQSYLTIPAHGCAALCAEEAVWRVQLQPRQLSLPYRHQKCGSWIGCFVILRVKVYFISPYASNQTNSRKFGSHLGPGHLWSALLSLLKMGDDESFKLISEVVKIWQRDPDLCAAAATGKLANVGKPQGLTRRDVDINANLIEPVLVKFGQLPALVWCDYLLGLSCISNVAFKKPTTAYIPRTTPIYWDLDGGMSRVPGFLPPSWKGAAIQSGPFTGVVKH